MAPPSEVQVRIDNNRDLIPGEEITGTATLTLSKPLSISELTITILGRAFSLIDRVYLVRNFQAEWRGQSFFFKRFVVLVPSPTVLPTGAHSFPFKFRLPTVTERVNGNWHLFMKWKNRSPFPGKKSVIPLPGTMSMGCNQTWGSTKVNVEYAILTKVKKGPEAGFFLSMPKDVRSLTVAFPPRPDLAQAADSAPWQQITRTIETPAGSANVTCRIPQVLFQGANVSIYFRSDRPLILKSLKVRLYEVYIVRARSVLWPEKRTKATDILHLVHAEGFQTPFSSEFLLVSSPKLPENAPMQFMTFNVACLAHWMEIKYRVAPPGAESSTKDAMKDISVQIQSRAAGRAKENARQGQQTCGEERSQVFNEEQYRSWTAEKKKDKSKQ